MKTDKKTVGFWGGFTDARTVRPRCRATAVLPRDCGSCYRVVAAKKDDSISRMPRWQRWGLYAFGALTLSGILPMTAAALLIWLCDLVGWWLLIPLYIVIGRAVWRVIWS